MTWQDWLIYASLTVATYSIATGIAWLWACYWPAHPVMWTIAITLTAGAAIIAGMYVRSTALALAYVGAS